MTRRPERRYGTCGAVFAAASVLLVVGCAGRGHDAEAPDCTEPIGTVVETRAIGDPAPEFHEQDTAPPPTDTLLRTPPRYVLSADSGYTQPRAGISHLCGVHLVVHDSAGAVVAELTAATGELDRQSDLVIARGEVIVELPQRNGRVVTEELFYAPGEDRVWSDVHTILREGRLVIEGESFTADRYFRNITIMRPEVYREPE